MIFQSLVTLLVAFLVGASGVVLKTIIRNQLALRRFKLKCRGTLRNADGFRLISANLISVAFKPGLNDELEAMFAKYGECFFSMYGPKPFVFTVDLDLIKTVVLDELNINRVSLDIPMRELETDSIMLAEGDQWRRMRRAIAPALTRSKFMTANVLKEINDSIDKVIDSFEFKLNESASDSIELDMDNCFHRYSLDLTLSTLFKQNNRINFHDQQDKLTQTFELGFLEMFKNPLFYMPIVFPILGPLVDAFVLRLFRIDSLRAFAIDFIRQQTELNLRARKELCQGQAGKRIELPEELTLSDGTLFRRNMIDCVIEHYLEGKLSQREYFHSVFFLFAAAEKTSADALSQTIYLLALHQDKQIKLRESVRLNGEDSTYLGWVLNESLRLQPPNASGCSRTIERDIETRRGAFIPKGTFLLTCTHAIHRLKEYWGDDANQFRPERFAGQRSFHPCQFMPFGAGPRQCPGKEFAMFEMKLLLSKLIMKYDFTCERKQSEAYDSPFFLFRIAHQPTIVKITRRKE